MITQSNITLNQFKEKIQKYQNKIENQAASGITQHNKALMKRLKGMLSDPYQISAGN
jgi:hypothetical protein